MATVANASAQVTEALTPFDRLARAKAAAYAANTLSIKALMTKTKIFSIGSLNMDIVVSEQHSYENEITDHPIHQGADISDHKRRKLRVLTVTGIVSNYPVVNAIEAISLKPNRDVGAWDTLVALAQGEELIDVYTTMGLYENMAILNLSTPRDAQSSNHIEFTCTLKEMLLVASDTTTVAVRDENGGLVNSGDKAGKPGKLQSILDRAAHNGIEGLKSALGGF